MRHPLRLSAHARGSVVGLAAAACVLFGHWANSFSPLEHFYQDAWHQVAGERGDFKHTALVVVDDATIDLLKDDPLAFWQPHFAEAMNRLDALGARAVALDMVYATSAENWLKRLGVNHRDASRNYDAPFRASLDGRGRVLAGLLGVDSKGAPRAILPPPEHLAMLKHGYHDVALANLPADADGIARHYSVAQVEAREFPGLSLGFRLALAVDGQNPDQASWQVGGQSFVRNAVERRIAFRGPPGSVPTVSMARLLKAGEAMSSGNAKLVPLEALRGKLVIITAHESSAMQDVHATPYARGIPGFSTRQMSGGEVHANVVETVLGAPSPGAPSWPVVALLLATLGVGTAWWFGKLSPVTAMPVAGVLLLLLAAAAYGGFLLDWLLPTAALQLVVVLVLGVTLALRLTAEERERRAVSTMFGSYVSPEVVNLLTTRVAEGRPLELGGEEMPATVLFSDIRDFTTISEMLTPTEVVEMLNAYFAVVCAPILAEQGNVNKYIGDAVMAVFGAPLATPDHALRALRAAVGMRDAALGFQAWMTARFGDRGLPSFRIGIGLHTGVLVSGVLGTVQRREYTVIGDTVNAASRLEGMSKELGWPIVASVAVFEAAGVPFDLAQVREVSLKGRAQPLQVAMLQNLPDHQK